jgi:hypothetical protein
MDLSRLSASDAVIYLSSDEIERERHSNLPFSRNGYFGDASGFMPVMEVFRDFVLMVRDGLVQMAICGDHFLFHDFGMNPKPNYFLHDFGMNPKLFDHVLG